MIRRRVLVMTLGSAAIAIAGAVVAVACVPSLHDADPEACTYDCLGGACMAGACQPFEIYERAASGNLFRDLAVNPDPGGPDVLYAASDDGNIYAVALSAPFVDGGVGGPVDSCKNADQIAVDNGRVVWTCKGNPGAGNAKIGRRKSNTEAPDTFYTSSAPDFAPVGIAAQNSRIAWANDLGDAGTVSETGFDNPNPSTDATMTERPGRMTSASTASGNLMFLVGTDGESRTASGIVYEIEGTDGGPATPLWNASAPKATFEFVAVTGTPTVLFGVQDVSSDNGQAPVLVRQPLPNGAERSIQLGADLGRGYGVALDDDGGTVFVATTDAKGSGRVFRVRTDDATLDAGAEQIATSASGADRVVYWSAKRAVIWSTHDNTTERIFGIALPQ